MHANHQNKFDLLRGVASIVVLLAHVAATFLYRFVGALHPLAQACGTLARHAVLVFFLLSGHLITQSIVANVQRNRRLDVREYLVARLARIYPALVGAILIVLLVAATIQGLALPGAQSYGIPGDLYAVRSRFAVEAGDVLHALLMQNGMLDADGPLWSLCIEFHLYQVALFVALAATPGATLNRIGAAAMAVAVVFWGISRDGQFAFYLAVWSVGAALSVWRVQAVRCKVAFAAIAWVGAGVHGVLLLTAPALLSAALPNVWVACGLQFWACMGYAYAMFQSGWRPRPARWLVRSGDFSYSLYVIHFPLLLLVLSATQDFMGASVWRSCAVAAGATLAVIGVASVFADFFEDQRRFKPALRQLLDTLPPGKRGSARP